MSSSCKYIEFYDILKENSNLSFLEAMCVMENKNLSILTKKEKDLLSAKASQFKNILIKKGLWEILNKKFNQSSPENLIGNIRVKNQNELAKIIINNLNNNNSQEDNNQLEQHNNIFQQQKSKELTTEQEKIIENINKAYSLIESGQLRSLETKESQIKLLTAWAYMYSGLDKENKAQNPQSAIKCVELIAKLTKTLDNNVSNININNIQVNNILQEIEEKRLIDLETQDYDK